MSGVVTAARREDDGGFRVTLDDGREVSARRLLVATGLVDELPDLPGRGRALGPRRPALPVLPRLGGPRPGDRHPRDRADRGAPGAAVPAAERRRHVLPAHRAGAPGRGGRAAGRPRRPHGGRRGRGAGGVRRPAHRRPPRLGRGGAAGGRGRRAAVHRRADVLASLGLEATDQEMRGHVVGSAVAADPTGATAVPGVWVAGNVADMSRAGGRLRRRGHAGRRDDQRRPRHGGRPPRRRRATRSVAA